MRPDVVNVRYRVKLVVAHFTLNKRIHDSSKMLTSTCRPYNLEKLSPAAKWHIFSQNFLNKLQLNITLL